MKKKYVAPMLKCDSYVPDTMIASYSTKNYRPDVNQNCWGCRFSAGATDPYNSQNSCFYVKDGFTSDEQYESMCH